MVFKAPLKIPLINAFVKLIPAKFKISRLEWADPIGRDLVRGAAPSNKCVKLHCNLTDE